MTLFEAGTPEKAGIRDSSSRQNQLNRNRNVSRLGASVLLASAALVPISDAAAQEPKMDEIVVTARKRVESLQDIPIAITAFSADAIEKRGIDSMADIARLSTSLVFETAFTPQDTRPVIRGLSATRGRQPVGILLDGIDVSSESLLTGGGGIGVNLNLVDVERIEVVKGPQSALYGRVAFGGAINYISRKPSDEFEARLGGDFGNYGQAMVSGSVSGPVIDDVLAVRVNGAYSNHDGFYENEISGDDIGDFESIGGAIALRFTPSEALTIDGRVSYSEDEAGPAAQYYVGTANGGTFAQPFPSEAQPLVDAGVFPATINLTAPGGQLRPAGPIQLSLDPLTGDDYRGSKTEALYTSLLVQYDFANNLSLNSWTGYSEVDGDYRVDTDFFGLPAVPVAFPTPGGVAEPLGNSFLSQAETVAQQFNQEIRFGDLVSDGFRWAVGGLYWREDYDMDAQNLITVVVAPPGQGSADLNTRLANPTTSQATFRNTEHWSVYGTLEFDLSDRLTASIEGRYSEESFDYQWFAGGTVAVSVFGPAGGITGPGEQFNASADESFFAPAFSLDYTINDDAMVYARIAKGVKPGGFSTVAAPRVENARYTEETLWNYEIGLKSTWLDNRVVFNSSIFYMDYGDKQFQTLIPDDTQPNGVAGLTVNAADSEIIGLEIDTSIAVTDAFTLGFGYTLLETQYKDFTNFVNSAVGVSLAGICEPTVLNGNPGCNVISDGYQLERLPKHSVQVLLGYRTTLANNMDFFANFDLFYQSKRFVDSTEQRYFDGYWDSDARIGVETEKWSALAYVSNVFEDDTVRGGTGTGDFHPFGSAAFALNAAPKRQYGVRLDYNF